MNKWKIILGGATGLVGIGGVVSAPTIYKSSFGEPSSFGLSSYTSRDFAFTEGLGGISGNRKYLVGGDSSNKEWWNWIYNNRFKTLKEKLETGSEFSVVTSGYDSGVITSLAKVCTDFFKDKKYISGDSGSVMNFSETEK